MSIYSPKDKKDVALIVGPTASGKSALALELAKKQPSVIINADSAQVYTDLQILSARPSKDEMESIDHRLYGYIDGAHTCSAARWASDAKAEIAAAHNKDLLPILVGGTGLYVRTLLNGIAPIPEIAPAIRAEVRNLEVADAYTALREEDPISADRLNPRDSSRIMRALEVVRSSGKPMVHWHAHMAGGITDEITLHPLVLLPPRDWLYERCDRRFQIMLDGGARDEVAQLLDRNLPDDCPVMRAIGVPEIIAIIKGDSSPEDAKEQAMAATRQYAKRQYTWFRNQCPADWPCYDEIINNVNYRNIVRLLQ
ncbi:tRNA (adenosine(37)-N6)-dimethylallyltransferase MiaA [Parasphingorhabdus cellanae]|uniref:tRNA dimethylallyltransferase n=1 Tax=Parasphingorhabdus cellanae TaxID=2806553 RepID=A0ABX7T7D5_9SPHN|nr:tRNA (adenosine(37)-N6)-dimethylallyltransferase MiaA [Parasphingorhabdus cellanae]QTD56369.1 tRNA (adenosine(37)-N6)-dimethylallyltransferase MiaA [Parasphingorhabdus cellanae]